MGAIEEGTLFDMLTRPELIAGGLLYAAIFSVNDLLLQEGREAVNDAEREAVRQKLIEAVEAERLEDPNLDDAGDAAYTMAIEHALTALRQAKL